MKCTYTFPLVSDAALQPSLRFQHRGLDFTLVSEQGRFSAIVISASGVAFPKLPTITHPPGQLPVFHVPCDPMLPVVQKELRTVRGALSMWLVHDIDVDSPKIEWRPETDEERQKTDILGHAMRKTPRGQGRPIAVSQDLLVRSIIARERLLPFQIPLEFFRRGGDDIYHERYIEAIYDFYYIFEYLYGDGSFKQSATKEAFLADKAAVEALTEAQKTPDQQIQSQPALMRLFVEKYQSKRIEEVVDTIIGVRGFLHHQSLRRRKNWNPGIQSDFKVDALFLFHAAHNTMIKLTTEILFLPEEMTAFLSMRFFTDDGRKITWVPTNP